MSAWHPIPIRNVDIDDILAAEGTALGIEREWIQVVACGAAIGVVDSYDPNARAHLVDLARRYRADPLPQLSDNALPSVSVVIPTIADDLPSLHATVASITAMAYPKIEIVVVDNRRSRHLDTLDLGEGNAVRVVRETHPGISAARNRGVSATSGELVLFTDDDAIVDPAWARRLGERFVSDPHIAGIGGLILPQELSTPAQLWFEEFYGGFSRSFGHDRFTLTDQRPDNPLFPFQPGLYGAGCNMAFRRTALEQIGPFNEALGTGTPARGGEDLDMFMRLILSGRTLAFEPSAIVRHRHRDSWRSFHRQVFGYGVGLSGMFTALVVRDPSQLMAIARRIRVGLAELWRPRAHRSPSARPSYPRVTLIWQILGLVYGPAAYAYSVARDRKTRE